MAMSVRYSTTTFLERKDFDAAHVLQTDLYRIGRELHKSHARIEELAKQAVKDIKKCRKQRETHDRVAKEQAARPVGDEEVEGVEMVVRRSRDPHVARQAGKLHD